MCTHTWDGLADKGDDVVLVGQGQAILAPENRHSGLEVARPAGVAAAAQHLAGAQVVHRADVCAQASQGLVYELQNCDKLH